MPIFTMRHIILESKRKFLRVRRSRVRPPRRNHSEKITPRLCDMTLVRAAPLTPRRGNIHQPKIRKGTRITWTIRVPMVILIGVIVSPEACIIASATIRKAIATEPAKTIRI